MLKDKSYKKNPNHKFIHYGDAEEKRTIRWERRLARQLNRKHYDEGLRYNHKGLAQYNKGKVTSTNGTETKTTLLPTR
jgi:hypothetical protein